MGGLPTGTINGFAVQPANAKTMYVAMRDGVYRSEDAGVRWTPASGSPRNVMAVAVHPKRPTEVYAATVEGWMFVSRDGGQTWEPVR